MKNLRDEHQRLWDIVRFFRSEALNKNLITMDEYGPLAEDHAAVARLEACDEGRDFDFKNSEATLALFKKHSKIKPECYCAACCHVRWARMH